MDREDGLHLSRVHANAVQSNDDTKVVLLKSFESMVDVIVVLLQRVQVDQDVVQVYNDKNIIHVMEDVVHEVLESSRGVGHTKGHYKVLKEAVAGAEGGFQFMPWSYMDVVIAGAEVDFGVDFGAAEAVNKVTNEGEGITVLFSDFVEAPIVNAKA
ncbi:hypothetical protein C0993_001859 [Termitomyces sp. T159_Od127]|nr:hypothetical protein C0993_001859 [Termitomyces sp. T159_Od127]